MGGSELVTARGHCAARPRLGRQKAAMSVLEISVRGLVCLNETCREFCEQELRGQTVDLNRYVAVKAHQDPLA